MQAGQKAAHEVGAGLPSIYSRDDLVQSGTLGLIAATMRYDPSAGAAFSTYAGRRIEGAIIDSLRKSDWAPRSVRSLERRLGEVQARAGGDDDVRRVAAEIGIDISHHRARSMADMEDWGDDIGAFDLIIALSPAAQRHALEYTRDYHVDVVYWPTLDPTGLGERREEKLDAYRQTRDQLLARIGAEFPAEG